MDGHTRAGTGLCRREARFAGPLLAHGARDTIYAAAARADASRVRELLAQDVLLARRTDANGWDALQYLCAVEADAADAAARRDVAAVLLDGGADPVEAVGWAAYAGHTDIIRLILSRGGPPPDAHGLTHAAESGYTDILKLAQQHGADLNDNTGNEHHGGYGPLGSMLKMRRSKGLAWLLEHGADPNRVYNEGGETALHIAVRAGCAPQVIATLLRHGAAPDAADATAARRWTGPVSWARTVRRRCWSRRQPDPAGPPEPGQASARAKRVVSP